MLEQKVMSFHDIVNDDSEPPPPIIDDGEGNKYQFKNNFLYPVSESHPETEQQKLNRVVSEIRENEQPPVLSRQEKQRLRLKKKLESNQ